MIHDSWWKKLAVALALICLTGEGFGLSWAASTGTENQLVTSETGLSGESDTTEPDRIVGGDPAPRGAYPFMVALVEAGSDPYWGQFCGGTLIHPAWVVTAAHCVTTENGSPLPSTEVEAYVGIYDLGFGGGERIAIREIIVHEAYDPFTVDSDIALLRLETSADVPPISPLGLTQTQLASPGTLATALGWGATDPEGWEYPDILREVEVPIVSNEICNSRRSYQGEVTSNMICAGYDFGGADPCWGDSGGPLLVANSERTGWLLAGITSWGEGCAEPYKYGVFTRVANFTSWISSHISDSVEEGPTVYHDFDIDANGVVDANTDGVLIYRYLRGFRGGRLIRNRIGAGATRTTAVEIERYLEVLIWKR